MNRKMPFEQEKIFNRPEIFSTHPIFSLVHSGTVSFAEKKKVNKTLRVYS